MANAIKDWLRAKSRRPAYICGLIGTILAATLSGAKLYEVLHQPTISSQNFEQSNGWKFELLTPDGIYSVTLAPVLSYPKLAMNLPPWFEGFVEPKQEISPKKPEPQNQVSIVPLPKQRPRLPPWFNNYGVVIADDVGDHSVNNSDIFVWEEPIRFRIEWRSCRDERRPLICLKSAEYRRTHYLIGW